MLKHKCDYCTEFDWKFRSRQQDSEYDEMAWDPHKKSNRLKLKWHGRRIYNLLQFYGSSNEERNRNRDFRLLIDFVQTPLPENLPSVRRLSFAMGGSSSCTESNFTIQKYTQTLSLAVCLQTCDCSFISYFNNPNLEQCHSICVRESLRVCSFHSASTTNACLHELTNWILLSIWIISLKRTKCAHKFQRTQYRSVLKMSSSRFGLHWHVVFFLGAARVRLLWACTRHVSIILSAIAITIIVCAM